MDSNTLVQKIWNFCHTLRDDGVGYGDYVEQLTYLLFLKMADEQAGSNVKLGIPETLEWSALRALRGQALETHYRETLDCLAEEPGLLGAIFFRAQNKIQDPEKLSRLIRLIDAETWTSLDVDAKGDLYEGLLQKNAEDTKSGAGQYFTPRAVIDAIVESVGPEAMKTIADPACGTGGFFLGAQKWLTRKETVMTPHETEFLRHRTFFGNEIVAETRRICLMNLFLHDIGDLDGEPVVVRSDALVHAPARKADYVLANPPFGKKSSMTSMTGESREIENALSYTRDDFWEATSNKQLNFLQHITTMLNETGKAAVVLPDNVLFEGGVGERIRRRLMKEFDVHTLLRLPSGIFYAHGVNANVLFFDAKPQTAEVKTKDVWIYDLRTNRHFTRKTKPLGRNDLRDFVTGYGRRGNGDRVESEFFKRFSYEDILNNDRASLDLTWIPESGPSDEYHGDPSVLQEEIIEHLESALISFREVAAALNARV